MESPAEEAWFSRLISSFSFFHSLTWPCHWVGIPLSPFPFSFPLRTVYPAVLCVGADCRSYGGPSKRCFLGQQSRRNIRPETLLLFLLDDDGTQRRARQRPRHPQWHGVSSIFHQDRGSESYCLDIFRVCYL